MNAQKMIGVVCAVLLLTLSLALADDAAPPNTLTDAEKKAGWKLLFDGKTTSGWRGYKLEKMPPGWQASEGALVRASGGEGGQGAGGGDDIVTTEEFDNFDLVLDWKVVTNGNSGVLYHVSEEPITAWHEAPEVQILDNTSHPTRDKRQLAGACYDLYAPAKDVAKGPGEWNRLRLLVSGPHVEHWLNGEKIVTYELGSDDWKARVEKSKHRVHPKFGTIKKGPIGLQDHTDRIEFRNIKIRPLPAPDQSRSSAIRAFQEAGNHAARKGSLTFMRGRGEPLGELTQLLLYTEKVDNRVLAQVAVFPELTVLGLYETRVDDDGLAVLARLPQLTQLSILPIDRFEKPGIRVVQWSYPTIPKPAAASAITDAGLKHLRSCPKLRTLDLADTQITIRGLTLLAELPVLQSLSLSAPLDESAAAALNGLPKLRQLRLTGKAAELASLKWVAKLPRVTALEVWDTRLDSQAIAALSDLTQLTELSLPNCGLTDASLKPLGHLVGLHSLRLGRNAIHGPGLAELKSCRDLKVLELDYANLADGDLRFLAELPALEDVMLNYNIEITNAGLASGVLQGLSTLRELKLRGLTRIDDGAYDAFLQMRQLRGLVVRSTPVSVDCVEKLRRARPELEILK